MTAPRVSTRCDGCGQTDDHPKMHYGVQTYHHDCIPAFVMDDLTSESTYRLEGGQYVLQDRVPLPEENMHPGTRQMLQIRKLAEGGTRGESLLAKIQKMPSTTADDDSKGK